MKKLISGAVALALMVTPAMAREYTVKKGDSMWKIATGFKIGLSEIKAANPGIKNADLIYPGDTLTIPEKDQGTESFVSEVVRLVNVERNKNGLSPLTEDWQLSRVAQYKAQDMHDQNYFDHQSPTYGTPFQMMKSFNVSYRYAAENIAKGQKTAEAVMNGWMNSSGHRANILKSDYTKIGVGYAKASDGTTYWVQIFKG